MFFLCGHVKFTVNSHYKKHRMHVSEKYSRSEFTLLMFVLTARLRNPFYHSPLDLCCENAVVFKMT